jgi:hypothetical protein
MKGIIDEGTLLGDCTEGLVHYGLPLGRAKVLAKTNLLFIAEEMYEAQDTALRDIAKKETIRKKGYVNES